MSSILKQSKYCILPFQTIETIRKYIINKCPRKLDMERNIVNSKVKTKNLVQIELNKVGCNDNSCNIHVATINIRSIKIKVEQAKETSYLENTEFIILKDTWLKDTDEDQAWEATSGLDNEEFRIDMVN